MNTNQNRKGKLVAASVVFMLVIVPIVSYVFLRKGLEYRVESLGQLEEKKIDDGLRTSLETYAGHIGNAQLIHIPGEEEASERAILAAIDEKIVDRDRFEIYSLSGDPDLEVDDDIKYVANAAVESEYSFILIDTSNTVRGVYPYSEDLKGTLIRHLAVVIPVPGRKTITLRRDSL